MRARWLAAILSVLLPWSAGARAGGGCALDDVIGYQVMFGRQIVGYIQGGKQHRGFEGCEPDRVLVFANNTGVRCKELSLRHLDDPPTGYLFAKSASEMKLCVDGELLAVSQSN